MKNGCGALTADASFGMIGEALYRVVLTVQDARTATRQVLQVVERARGDLRRLSQRGLRPQPKVESPKSKVAAQNPRPARRCSEIVAQSAERHPVQVSLELGARRIGDVVTALEAAGFDVAAVVATYQPWPASAAAACVATGSSLARAEIIDAAYRGA